MKYLCICSNRSGSHFLEKALQLPSLQDYNFRQKINNFKEKEAGLFRFHSINHAKEKYDVFMDWTKTFIAQADLIHVHIRANVFDMSLSQVVRKTIHSYTMNDVSLEKLNVDVRFLDETYELNKTFMLQFGSDIEKETDSLEKETLWTTYEDLVRDRTYCLQRIVKRAKEYANVNLKINSSVDWITADYTQLANYNEIMEYKKYLDTKHELSNL